MGEQFYKLTWVLKYRVYTYWDPNYISHSVITEGSHTSQLTVCAHFVTMMNFLCPPPVFPLLCHFSAASFIPHFPTLPRNPSIHPPFHPRLYRVHCWCGCCVFWQGTLSLAGPARVGSAWAGKPHSARSRPSHSLTHTHTRSRVYTHSCNLHTDPHASYFHKTASKEQVDPWQLSFVTEALWLGIMGDAVFPDMP